MNTGLLTSVLATVGSTTVNGASASSVPLVSSWIWNRMVVATAGVQLKYATVSVLMFGAVVLRVRLLQPLARAGRLRFGGFSLLPVTVISTGSPKRTGLLTSVLATVGSESAVAVNATSASSTPSLERWASKWMVLDTAGVQMKYAVVSVLTLGAVTPLRRLLQPGARTWKFWSRWRPVSVMSTVSP